MPDRTGPARQVLGEAAYLRALVALVEQSPVGMCVLDRRGTFLAINETLAATNGVTVENHIGRTVEDVVPELWAHASEAFERGLRTQVPLVDMLIEGTTPQSPGELRAWLQSWFPLPADGTGEDNVAVIVREVTTERRMTQELQAADQRKDEFLATLAHELRNPLAPLANCVQLLRAVPRPEVGSIASMMERQLIMLVRLVEDLGDASRIRSGKLDLRWETVDLPELLRETILTSAETTRARNHAVTESLPRQPVFVRADPVRLKQLFCNLLTNACKFTPPGGQLSVGVVEDGVNAIVSVSDTGIGIPTGRLHSIFARLAQADAPSEMREQGLGIGLWLAREIAELHGGDIEAFSEGLGRGSRFEVRLPLLQAA